MGHEEICICGEYASKCICNEDVSCPFCGEAGFDLYRLAMHLTGEFRFSEGGRCQAMGETLEKGDS